MACQKLDLKLAVHPLNMNTYYSTHFGMNKYWQKFLKIVDFRYRLEVVFHVNQYAASQMKPYKMNTDPYFW